MSFHLLATEDDTKKLAEVLAESCFPEKTWVIFLSGTLGAGKTTFARHFIHHLGYSGIVRSPTYALVEIYAFPQRRLYHLDLYRLESSEAFLETGLQDEFDQPAIWLIEWPERATKQLPPPDLRITFSSIENQQRRATLDAYTVLGQQAYEQTTDLQSFVTKFLD